MSELFNVGYYIMFVSHMQSSIFSFFYYCFKCICLSLSCLYGFSYHSIFIVMTVLLLMWMLWIMQTKLSLHFVFYLNVISRYVTSQYYSKMEYVLFLMTFFLNKICFQCDHWYVNVSNQDIISPEKSKVYLQFLIHLVNVIQYTIYT